MKLFKFSLENRYDGTQFTASLQAKNYKDASKQLMDAGLGLDVYLILSLKIEPVSELKSGLFIPEFTKRETPEFVPTTI